MAARVHSLKVLIFAFILDKLTVNCHGNDILGCGGFVKSHVALDFAKIEIGLYTKAGTLKERTECVPTNGYYFLPLYEKGEYVLKVHPPAGWSFEPSQVDIVVDGTSDPCSTGQDINFSFNGFGITGRVITAGQTKGPSGISVQLINEKGEIRDTVSAVGGDFHFTPVIPGKYTLKASHPRWKLEPAQAVVQVKEGNTALPVGVLAVKGYDVRGSITSYGNPIGGIYVLLYSKEENPKFRVEGCKTSLLQGVPDSPICHSITDSQGEFSFGLVPAGDYRLLALTQPPGQATIRYIIKPETVPLSVAHDSLYIKKAFEVQGFTIVGSVLTSTGGSGISGARVLKDGQAIGNSDATGKFTLPALQPGTYTLSFQHEQCEFNDMKLEVTSSGPTAAPVAKAERWRVCGAVAPPDERQISITADKGHMHTTVQVTKENGGKWCTYLPPGVYSSKVEVAESEQREGLQFYPLTQKITVGHSPVDGLLFSQLKAKLKGRVQCKTPSACENLKVTLKPLSLDGGYVGQPMTTVAKNGEYTFEEVLPGSVEVSVPAQRLCWAEARHNVAVATELATVPPFEHTGYVLTVHSSHTIEVEYKSQSSKGVLAVPAGRSEQCVGAAERYELTPRGPHRFAPPAAAADLTRPDHTPIEFVATAHAVVLKVVSPEPVGDLVLRVGAGPGAKEVGPLVPLQQPGGGFGYEHTLFMAEGEIAVVSAHSSTLLFQPPAPQQVVGRAEHQPEGVLFRGVRGLTLAGRVVPPVADVTVTLTSDDVKLTQTTGADGEYSFGPLDASKRYAITCEKESYLFGDRDENGDIVAHKLAEIIVELVDEADGTPLQGALVSVSGGSYRRNLVSAGAPLRFPALPPALYYVTPHCKEYRFAAPHTSVDVRDSHSHTQLLKGTRVAWSAIGSLVSLSGAGWGGAIVAAVPEPHSPHSPPHCVPEETTTSANAGLRIRGLLPNCVYTLQLKESTAPELQGLTLVKAPPKLEIKGKKDIENIQLIAIQPAQVTDVGVMVYSSNAEHYKSLRLTLAGEDTPHTPIYSTKMDAAGYNAHFNPGLMYTLPRLAADNKTYVLTLESTLSKTTHTYGEEVHYFNSDGQFKAFDIVFSPKVKSSEQELRQTSLLIIPLLGALVLAYFHRDALLQQVTELVLSAAKAPPKPKQNKQDKQDLLDKASIDQILNTVNAAGKRTAKKKTQ